MSVAESSDLLLCGGGHAHLFVLEALAGRPRGTEQVTLVSAHRQQVYSGMLPGVIGERYAEPEITLDLAALCSAAGVRFVQGEIRALNAATKTVTLADGRQLHGKVLSVAVGSVVAGFELPGVADHALLVKPIDRALGVGPALDAAAARSAGRPVRVVVVGAGAAGCELAFAAHARLTRRGAAGEVTIVDAAAAVLAEREPAVQQRVAEACGRLGVTLELGARVAQVAADAVQLQDGRTLAADVCIWASGSAAPAWLAASGLRCDPRGYLLVDAHLRALEHPDIFAAGDTATPVVAPMTPKAGVYAVRAGPVLAENLLASLRQARPSSSWTPQRSFLALLNTGDGRAILAWRGWTAEGRWVMRLKDWIDRGFLRRFSRLAAGARRDPPPPRPSSESGS